MVISMHGFKLVYILLLTRFRVCLISYSNLTKEAKIKKKAPDKFSFAYNCINNHVKDG